MPQRIPFLAISLFPMWIPKREDSRQVWRKKEKGSTFIFRPAHDLGNKLIIKPVSFFKSQCNHSFFIPNMCFTEQWRCHSIWRTVCLSSELPPGQCIIDKSIFLYNHCSMFASTGPITFTQFSRQGCSRLPGPGKTSLFIWAHFSITSSKVMGQGLSHSNCTIEVTCSFKACNILKFVCLSAYICMCLKHLHSEVERSTLWRWIWSVGQHKGLFKCYWSPQSLVTEGSAKDLYREFASVNQCCAFLLFIVEGGVVFGLFLLSCPTCIGLYLHSGVRTLAS